MKLAYDPRGDILFAELGDLSKSPGATEIAPGIYADITEDGTLLYLQILNASRKYDGSTLNRLLAYPEESISLAEASRITGISQQGLKKAAQDGRLTAKKVGRNWQTTVQAATDYKEGRKHDGNKVATIARVSSR